MNPDAHFKYRETAFRIDKINKLLGELEDLNRGKIKLKKKKKKKRNLEEVDLDSKIRVEMKNRIDKIRRILEKLKRSEEEDDSEEDDSEEEAAAAAEEDDSDSDEDSDEKLRQISPSVGDEQLIYNIDDCKTAKRLKEYAKVALGYFNVTNRIIYYVVDVIKANKYLSAGCVSLSLTFTAIDQLREATTFESRISFKVGLTEVEFIRVVPT